MILFFCLQEYEKKMVPWLYCFAVFTLFRLFAFVFGSIVNDMIFGYNIAMCVLWIIYTVASVYGWLLVYSLYLELSDLTKLEDLAHLRVSRLLIYSIFFLGGGVAISSEIKKKRAIVIELKITHKEQFMLCGLLPELEELIIRSCTTEFILHFDAILRLGMRQGST